MNHDTLIQQLQWRYAAKRFDPNKKVSESDMKTLEESLRLAPSSFGLQPWKFIVVQSADLKAKLRPASWDQHQITECSHLVVITAKQKVDQQHIEKFIAQVSKVRGVPKEALKGYEDMMVGAVVNGPIAPFVLPWAQRQCYIAMGFLLETAALLKIDTCPMEGIDSKAYDEILGLNGSGFGTVAVVAVGYRGAEDPTQNMKKVRFDAAEVVVRR